MAGSEQREEGGGGANSGGLPATSHRLPRIQELEIGITELAEGAMRADFGGADGAFEDAGDFREGEFLESREQEHFAVIVIQAGEGHVEQFVIIAGGGVLRRVRGIVGMLVQGDRIGGPRRGARLAEMIGGTAAREMIHPCGEAPVVAISVPVLQHALKNRLRDVFRRGPVAGELDQKTEQRPVMPFEKLAQRIEFASADGEHQGVVGSWFAR